MAFEIGKALCNPSNTPKGGPFGLSQQAALRQHIQIIGEIIGLRGGKQAREICRLAGLFHGLIVLRELGLWFLLDQFLGDTATQQQIV